MIQACSSVAELQQLVREAGDPVLPVGSGTKPGLWQAAGAVRRVSLSGLSGLTEYDPAEFTFTARAGTPLQEIVSALAAHGQYLPFDPPLIGQGATLGGTVAAGLSGSGLWKSGGLRDFILGVKFIDGLGHHVRGGGRVVKNAAGFDLPKFLVGSGGRLGILTEVCMKVFPRPAASLTLRADFENLPMAVQAARRLAWKPFDLHAIDLEPPGKLVVRLSGDAGAIAALVGRVEKEAGCAMDRLAGEAEQAYWLRQSAMHWLEPGDFWLKLAIRSSQMAALDALLEQARARRRYAACGQLVWVGWPDGRSLDPLEQWLRAEGISGLMLRGETGRYRIGVDPADAFLNRVRKAIDPSGRFARCAGGES